MERLPSDTDKDNWDSYDDTDVSPRSNKKSKPAAAPSIFREPTPLPKSGETNTRPSFFDSKESKEKTEKEPSHEEISESPAEKTSEEDSFEGEVEKLSPEEVQVIVQHYVAERSKVLDQELADADPESPTAQIAQADKRLLEALDERTQAETESSLDDNLEQAASQVIEDMNETGQDQDTSEDDNTDTSAAQPSSGPQVRPTAASPHSAANTPSQPSPQPASHGQATTPLLPRQTPAAPSPTTSPAAGGVPPRTVHHPTFGGPPMPPSPNFSAGANTSPNTIIASSPAEHVAAPEQTKDRLAQGLLIGGVVGYLIGRRRGRIKTEKRLMPIQEKLQKEVSQLEQKIVVKEQEVRSVAAQKAILEQAAAKAKAEKPKPIVGTPEKMVAPEALAIQTTPDSPIPKVESPRFPHAEATHTPQQAKVEQIVQDQNVDHLPLPKVLKAAEVITVGSTSLARTFEAGQIDEAGLRHIVAEFARTGSVERTYKAEVSAHQKRKQSSERITTILNPEEGVRKKPLTSRSRDTNYVSVRHDLTPLDTAGLSTTKQSAAEPSLAKAHNKPAAANNPHKHQPTLVVGILLLGLVVIVWLMIRQ